jgi:hypothetical protein
MEAGQRWPSWTLLARLVRALGPDLVTLGLAEIPVKEAGSSTTARR